MKRIVSVSEKQFFTIIFLVTSITLFSFYFNAMTIIFLALFNVNKGGVLT